MANKTTTQTQEATMLARLIGFALFLGAPLTGLLYLYLSVAPLLAR